MIKVLMREHLDICALGPYSLDKAHYTYVASPYERTFGTSDV
jgi:hypothetical protein